MLYEPACREGESRDGYLERFAVTNRPLWSALSAEEWACILDHVTHCDFPETPSGWMGLGRTAGFGRVEQEFVAPTDLYRMFRYGP